MPARRQRVGLTRRPGRAADDRAGHHRVDALLVAEDVDTPERGRRAVAEGVGAARPREAGRQLRRARHGRRRVDVGSSGNRLKLAVRVLAGQRRRVGLRVGAVVDDGDAVRQRARRDDAHGAHAPADDRRGVRVIRPVLALVGDVRQRREVRLPVARHVLEPDLVARRTLHRRPADQPVGRVLLLGDLLPRRVETERRAPAGGAAVRDDAHAHPEGVRFAGHPRDLQLDRRDRRGEGLVVERRRLAEDAARRELELVARRAAHGVPGEGRHQRVRVVGLDGLVRAVDERVEAARRRRRLRRRTAGGGREDERKREQSKEGAPHVCMYRQRRRDLETPIEGRPGRRARSSGAYAEGSEIDPFSRLVEQAADTGGRSLVRSRCRR